MKINVDENMIAEYENYEKTYCELIHLYCISPIIDAGNIFGRQDYLDKADLIITHAGVGSIEMSLERGKKMIKIRIK